MHSLLKTRISVTTVCPMPRSIPLILRMKYGNLKTENWSKRLIFKKGQHFSGGKDGLIYASKEAAKKSQLNPDQGAYTYMNGKCAYRALWNRQTVTADGKSIVNADTRRNNTYLLTIKGFPRIGHAMGSFRSKRSISAETDRSY